MDNLDPNQPSRSGLKEKIRRLRRHLDCGRPWPVVAGVWLICLTGAVYQISSTTSRFLYSSKTDINMDYSTIYHIPGVSICMDFVHLLDPERLLEQNEFMEDLLELVEAEASTPASSADRTSTLPTGLDTNQTTEASSTLTAPPDSSTVGVLRRAPRSDEDEPPPSSAPSQSDLDAVQRILHDTSLHSSIYTLLDEHFDSASVATLLRPADTMIVEFKVPSNARPGYLPPAELHRIYRQRQHFKGKQLCYSFSSRGYLLHRINLLELRSRGVIFELHLNATGVRRVPYFSVYLHEQDSLPRNYQSSLFEVLESREQGASVYGLTYNRYVHTLQADCRDYAAELAAGRPSDDGGGGASMAEAVEECINNRTFDRFSSAFWNNVYPVDWRPGARLGFIAQVLHFEQHKGPLFEMVDECEHRYRLKDCVQEMFVPQLKTVLQMDAPRTKLVITAPLEPEIAIRVTSNLSPLEYSIYVGSVLACWLAFTVVTALHSLVLALLSCLRSHRPPKRTTTAAGSS